MPGNCCGYCGVEWTPKHSCEKLREATAQLDSFFPKKNNESDLITELANAQSDLAVAETTKQAYRNRIHELDDLLAAEKRERENDRAEAWKRVADKASIIDRLNTDLAAANARASELEQENALLTDGLGDAQSDLVAANARAEAAERKWGESEQQHSVDMSNAIRVTDKLQEQLNAAWTKAEKAEANSAALAKRLENCTCGA